MKHPFKTANDETGTALVIVFPPEFRGLFNPRVHELVSAVQEQLHGVYVTYALSSGSCPDLRASIAAARFAGRESAVIVLVEASDTIQLIDHGSNGDILLSASLVEAELDASAVVDAYRAAVAEARRAA